MLITFFCRNHQFFLLRTNFKFKLKLKCVLIYSFSRIPKTTYVKMMDIWQIGSLILPFLEVVLQTSIHNLKRNKKNKMELAPKKEKTKLSTIKPFMDEFNLGSIVKPLKNELYQSIENNDNEFGRMLTTMEFIATFGIPSCYALFIICFYITGTVQPNGLFY